MTGIIREITIGPCRLIQGDCLEVLPMLGKVDAVVTDPPYGVNADKKNAHSSIRDNSEWEFLGWDSNRPRKEIFDYMSEFPAVIWGGNYFADWLPASSGWLAWIKPEAGTGFSLADMELAWTSMPIAARTFFGARRDGNQHPTQKTVAVMEWSVKFVDDAETILDPFMGSGTTGVAAIKTGKQFIGVEREPKYFDIACNRIRRAWQDKCSEIKFEEPEPLKQLELV